MSFAAVTSRVFASEGESGFQPPSVKEAYFPDSWDPSGAIDGSYWYAIGSWKVTALLVIGTAFIAIFFVTAARRSTIVPGKLQFFAEGFYSFMRNQIAIDVMGKIGKSWAPFLATLFAFVFVMNALELVPFAMIPVTSHFVFPAALAMLTWFLYNFVGIKKYGVVGYFKNQCVISGIPWPMHILLVPLEFLSKILLQPFTLAVRLFANMFAGHMLVALAGAGTIYLLQSGGLNTVFAVLPAAASVGLWFFELLICTLQAYVFVLLTAVYLEGALAEAH